MNTEYRAKSIWLQDVPSASDLTFVLATLRRIEQRRFRRDLLSLAGVGGVGGMLLWLLWPMLAMWFTPLLALLQSMTPLDVMVVSLAIAVVMYFESRAFR